IGSVLTTNPSVLVLDEPTSALDPGAAEEVLAAIQRLVFDLGLTVLMAEHRLERVVQYADRLVVIENDGSVSHGDPAQLLATAPVAPPVVELGRRLHLDPLPLSVRDARRATAPWRRELLAQPESTSTRPAQPTPSPAPVGAINHLSVLYGKFAAVADLTTEIRPGEIVALMGRNGAGKSTLLNTLVGLRKADIGSVRVGPNSDDPFGMPGCELLARVGLVPQEAADMLYAQTVTDECSAADHDSQATAGTVRALLERFAPGIDDQTHPRDLSEGQRLCLVLAIVLSAKPPLLLLDEPTRGLDYPGKRNFTAVLQQLARDGHGIVMATHDVELVATTATRVLIIADGELVADGPTAEVVVSSPMFAPQISKVLRPTSLLTVEQAVTAIDVAQAL
ncbi:MAG: ATP-binding cassette domain-containing protein, partial [Actinobacteria bacterium]|nr:ATP-binding cassette domain-containing protein [Actinomycetota bacterium]